MLHRSIPIATLALAGLFALPVHAQQLQTVQYRGTVTFAGGPVASAFTVGEPITLSYTVDTGAPDLESAPNAGWYFSGMQSLTLTLPDSGFDLAMGPGPVAVYDNVGSPPSDQAFLYTGAVVTGDTLLGASVTAVEFEALDYPDTAGQIPSMLTSDAIPTTRLVGDERTIRIGTAAGWTSVTFVDLPDAPAPPTVAELIEDAIERIARHAGNGALGDGIANALTVKLQAVSRGFAAGNANAACGAWSGFHNQVARLPRGRLIDAAAADELLALADALRVAMGGCGR